MRREQKPRPLSEPSTSGRPCSSISRSRKRVTRPELSPESASSARYLRVYASTTLRMHTILPVASLSTGSIAHSRWPARAAVRQSSGVPTACVCRAAPSALLTMQRVDPLHIYRVTMGRLTMHTAADSYCVASNAPASIGRHAARRCGQASYHSDNLAVPFPAACRLGARSNTLDLNERYLCPQAGKLQPYFVTTNFKLLCSGSDRLPAASGEASHSRSAPVSEPRRRPCLESQLQW